MIKVLSLDVATNTGWSFFSNRKRDSISFGLIKTNPDFDVAERLCFFRQELVKLLHTFTPTHVVIEDVFLGFNVKTLILISKFAGVTLECCMTVSGIHPYIINTNTVKSYFKAENKEDVFNMIKEIFGWTEDEINFKKHNDITDSIAQLMCFCDSVLQQHTFRFERKYGYLYEV
jgi:Holliday junction resolvasome RuvABC endonuclease subunit